MDTYLTLDQIANKLQLSRRTLAALGPGPPARTRLRDGSSHPLASRDDPAVARDREGGEVMATDLLTFSVDVNGTEIRADDGHFALTKSGSVEHRDDEATGPVPTHRLGERVHRIAG